MDFTLEIYEALLVQALNSGYQFQTFEQYIESPKLGKVLVLRHDVDRIPINAHKMAKIERKVGVDASYFFRIVKSVYIKPCYIRWLQVEGGITTFLCLDRVFSFVLHIKKIYFGFS